MHFPVVTSLYAGLFGLLYVALSLWVSAGRFKLGVVHGDGGQEMLQKRIRAHANFGEYVPIVLLITALAEGQGAASFVVHILLLPFLVARLLHPLGMIAPVGSSRQFMLRGAPAIVTWLVLAAASVVLLAGSLGAIG